MKYQYIKHKRDLFRFKVDITGHLHGCEVSDDNRSAPWRVVPLDQVPLAALNQLTNVTTESHHDILRDQYLEEYRKNTSKDS